MYRGFKIEKLNSNFFFQNRNTTVSSRNFIQNYDIKTSRFYQKGKEELNTYKVNVETNLGNFIIGYEGELDGSAIQEKWFSQVNCDVFISHSHQDEDLAIAFAGWLKENFNISSFIDSCIWGYADNLLKIIDDRHCKNYVSNTYNYHKRNLSTSHVHSMLSMALMQMIDNTECLFFLNTPNSISLKDIETRTFSPWIYLEIGMSRMIRERQIRQVVLSEANELASYKLDLSHLRELCVSDLNDWKINSQGDALNYLYTHYPPNKVRPRLKSIL